MISLTDWANDSKEPVPLAPEIPLCGILDEFGFPIPPHPAAEKPISNQDLEEAKLLLHELSETTNARETWLKTKALLERLP